MDAKDFLAEIRLHRKLFLAIMAACVAVGLGSAIAAPAKYVSTTQLIVSIEGATTASAYENDQVVSGRVNSYVALLTSEVVNQRVIDELGLSRSARDLADDVSATIVPPRTAVIDVAVSGETPEEARLLAATLASEFISYTDVLERPTGADDQKVHVAVVNSASTPRGSLPRPLTFGVLGALAGLVLGSVAVWLRVRADPVVRTPERAAAVSGLPVIGSVSAALSVAGESLDGYRRLRTRLLSMTGWSDDVTARGRVWVVTCAAGETSSATPASNLGGTFAAGEGRVIVVDAGSAGAAGEFDVESGPGLFDVLAGSASADQAIRCRLDQLPDVLPAGSGHGEPADLLATSTMRRLVHRLRTEYSHIVIAAPPVLPTVAASMVSEYADGVLLVVTPGTTRRRELALAAEKLRMAGNPLTGTVMCTDPVEPALPAGEQTPRSSSIPEVESDEMPSSAR
ncbi:Wzz/FepE/Etk N-terminal domain-containing protein [Rhodococcus sp. NPDC058514]|uniref:Wzz/FepE/Etk N-terminal domain-containing protein n=1 Tax=unclassified Rhodococcus (in: high G+C Gram-positive bacteria) TaxID=192944 RepID=UPI003655E292